MLGTPLGTPSGGAFPYKTPAINKKNCFNIEREARLNLMRRGTRFEQLPLGNRGYEGGFGKQRWAGGKHLAFTSVALTNKKRVTPNT